MLKPISMLDDVYEKYFDMVSNDNDSNYVMNALPELKNCKKDDNMQSKDFGSGRLSRLSNLFEGLSLDTVVVPLKNVPSYYHGPNGKGLVCMRLVLLTKSKV